MTKKTSLILSLLAILFMIAPYHAEAKGDKWKLTTSGELHVVLEYAENDVEMKRQVEIKTKKKETNCGGGSLVGMMDCVAEKIEGAGGTGTEKKKYKTVIDRVDLLAEFSSIVTPVIEVIEEGKKYKVTLDMSKMTGSTTKYTGPFDMTRKKQILREESKVKRYLRAWSIDIGPDELTDMIEKTETDEGDDKCGSHCESYFFNEAFEGLQLLERLRPKEPKVVVYYTSSDCFELEVEFIKAQQDYLELEAAIPFTAQFELLARTMTEIEDTFAATAKELGEVGGEFDKVLKESPVEGKLGEYMEKSKGLSKTLTQSLEGIKETIKDEREAIIEAGKTYTKPLKEVRKALGQSQKTMEKVASTAKNINSYIATAKIMVDARNMSAPDQLKAFGKYFGEVVDRLDPLLKTIPVIGVFLDLYAQAIEQIAVSAEKIESVVKDRNKQAALLRATGSPWFRDPYKILNTADERLKAEKNKLFSRGETLKNRLLRECNVKVPWTEKYDHYDKIKDAGRIAENACKHLKKDYNESAKIKKAFEDADKEFKEAHKYLKKRYKKIGFKDSKRVKRSLSALKKAESFHEYVSYNRRPDERQRRNILLRLNELKKIRGYLTEAEKSIRHDVKSARKKYINLEEVDIRAIDGDNFDVRALKKDRERESEARKELKKAKADMTSLRDNNKRYKDCKKDFLRERARDKGWKMKDVELEHFDLFRDK